MRDRFIIESAASRTYLPEASIAMKSAKSKSCSGMKLYRGGFLAAFAAMALALPAMVRAETVGVFFDPAVAQIKFATGDVKEALESKNFTVEMLPIASLNASYPNKKVVVALASDTTVTAVLAAQSGSAFWTTWFDEMARNRYNVVSIWTNHPFTSMINCRIIPMWRSRM